MGIENYEIIEKVVDVSILENKTRIFNFIYELQMEAYSTNPVDKALLFIISFNKKIKIDPLFLILLINFYTKYKTINIHSSMSINISNLDKQGVFHRFLTHFADMQYFIDINYIHRTECTVEDIKYLFSNRKNGLYLEQTTEYKSYPFTKDAKGSYKFYTTTPIIKVTNTVKEELVTGNREDIYNIFVFDAKKSFKDIRDNHKKALTSIFESLDMKEEILSPFSNIFFEVLHNIKKHTKNVDDSLANAYVNFRTDWKDDFEFLITDDAEKGFLNNYKDVLIKEKNDLKHELGKKIDNKLLSSYTLDIATLDKDTLEDDKEILVNLFDINKTFSTHQIPRLMMHFGVPLLLQILNNYPTSKLDIFLHRKSPKGDRFYHLQFKEGKLLKDDIEVFNNGVYGTYIYIFFPKNKQIVFNGIIGEKAIPMTLKNTDYFTMFNFKNMVTNKYVIEERINRFQQITLDYLEEDEKIPEKNRPIIIDYQEIGKETLADFFRFVYLFAYKHYIKDIVLINMPLLDEKDYFSTLTYILFSDKESDDENHYVRNLLSYDKASLNILFIGGQNKKQFCSINKNILERYSQDNDSITSTFCDNYQNETIHSIESELFVNFIRKDYMLLPFELYWKNKDDKMFLFQDILESYLESRDNNQEIHVDTGGKYHLNKFYFLKYIFEDSVWINRIAYTLAQKIREEEFPDKANISLIGIGQYSSLVISIAHSLLELENEYFIINDFKNSKKYKEFLKPRKDDKDIFIFFAPVILNGRSTKDFLLEAENEDNPEEPRAYCAIKMGVNRPLDDEEECKFKPFLNKNIIDNIKDEKNCSECFLDDTPLYKLSSDGFSIKDIYIDYNKEVNTIFTTPPYTISKNIFWKDSIYFGHVSRGTNHYLYYTKTIKFFNDNKVGIKEFLKSEVVSQRNIEKKKVIFSPIHDTNNNFITLVDKEVFDNDAIIHHFNLSEKEQNLYQLERLKKQYKDNDKYAFYFVDDEISSGGTLEYFYTLLREITPNKKFTAIFVGAGHIWTPRRS